jgi:hypothetical protein
MNARRFMGAILDLGAIRFADHLVRTQRTCSRGVSALRDGAGTRDALEEGVAHAPTVETTVDLRAAENAA